MSYISTVERTPRNKALNRERTERKAQTNRRGSGEEAARITTNYYNEIYNGK